MNRIVQLGFTLIELMVTLVILAILVAIAYPSYMHWTTVTRRSDAEIGLTQLAAQEEKFFADCNAYTSSIGATESCQSATLAGSGYSPDGYYVLTAKSPNPNDAPTSPPQPSYLLKAVPMITGPQANDTQCTSFTLDEKGNKLATGTATDCWKK